MTTTNDPVELRYYDHNADDNRGRSHHEGFYRSREKAEAVCAKLNADELSRVNQGAEWRHFNMTYKNWTKSVQEHNALVDAGLREGPKRDETVPQFVPVSELPDYYFVSELDYEDDK